MTRNDEELTRLRQAFAAPPGSGASGSGELGEAARQPADHPEPDRIWEAVRGELPPDEVREIVEHVAVCSSCAEDWRIAMAFEEESHAAETAEAPSNVIRPPVSRFRHWKAATGAIAAALVLAVVGIQLRPEKTPPVYRSGNGSVVEVLKTPSAPRESFVLAWKPAAGAESYELLVSATSELRVIVEPKGLTATEYQVPASALAGIPDGARLSWIVTAVFPDGSRQESPTMITALE